MSALEQYRQEACEQYGKLEEENARLNGDVIYEQERNAANVRAYSDEVEGLRRIWEAREKAIDAALAILSDAPCLCGDESPEFPEPCLACQLRKALKGEK